MIDFAAIRALEHPHDMAKVARALEAAALELHECAPGCRLQGMTHEALCDLERAAAGFEAVGDGVYTDGMYPVRIFESRDGKLQAINLQFANRALHPISEPPHAS